MCALIWSNEFLVNKIFCTNRSPDFDDEDNLIELNEDEPFEGKQANAPDQSGQLSQDRKRTSRIKVFGSTIAEEKADDSFDESFNLDDENVLDDDEDNSDLDSEDEIELMNLTNDKDMKMPKPQQIGAGDVESDDDF